MRGRTDSTADAVYSAVSEDLAAAITTARQAWPGIVVDEAVFAAQLSAKAPAPDHVAELYLACACAGRDPAALAAFEKAYFSEIDAAWRQRTDLTVGRDDVAQIVRERLLVGTEPRIAGYSGRGSLRSWFRISVVRVVSNLAARPRREITVEDDVIATLPVLTADPELEYMKRLYHAEFRAALHDAVGKLERRERHLLRHSLVDGTSIDQLAVLYGAHRATLARWIAAARETLFKTFRASLMEKLQIDRQELDSVLRLVQSCFDVSVERLFNTAP